MLKFAANLSMLFKEVPFLDRFERAAKAGFEAVEFQFAYEFDPMEIAVRLKENQLQLVLMNMPAGDLVKGDRGIAALPGREEEFQAGVEVALAYARRLGCGQLHAMAGIVPAGADRAPYEHTFIENIRLAADAAAGSSITILIEAINHRDVPGYLVAHQDDALDFVRRIDRPDVAIQFDCYHAQLMNDDVPRLLERMAGAYAHVQIASVPDRHEPDEGDLDYRRVFDTLRRIGYTGWIGCEYNPRGDTEAGLAWLAL